MKKIDLDKETSFDLEMEIHGDVPSGTKSNVHFTILSENMNISFTGKKIENGVYRVTIPPLKNILEAGLYNFQVNVIVGEKYFSPIQESVQLIEEIKPIIKMKSPQSPENNIEIKITENVNKDSCEKKSPLKIKKIGTIDI